MLSAVMIARLINRAWARTRSFLGGMLRTLATPREAWSSLASPNTRAFVPGYWRARLAVTIADAVLIALLVVFAPIALVPLALVVGAAAAWYAWRARPGWGAKHGLPPGRVSVGSRPLHDPMYLRRASERFGGLFSSNHFLEPMVCVVGMDQASALLTEHADELSTVPVRVDKHIPQNFLRWQHGDRHAEFRRVFGHALGLPLLRGIADRVTTAIDDTLETAASNPDGVRVRPWLRDFVADLWFDVFLGVSLADPRLPELTALYDHIGVDSRRRPAEVEQALARIEELVARGPTDPNATTVVSLLCERLEANELSPAELRNVLFLLASSRRDLAGLLTWALKHAVDHPHHIDALRGHEPVGLEHFDNHSLANRMVSETVRLEQSEHLFRRPMEPLEWAGYTLPEGMLIRVCTHESHRDPVIFAEPDSYDPDRFTTPTVFGSNYAPFGIGDRSCIGESLSRRITAGFLTQLGRGYDPAVVDDGPREMGIDGHWAPNRRLCIRLDPVGAASATGPR